MAEITETTQVTEAATAPAKSKYASYPDGQKALLKDIKAGFPWGMMKAKLMPLLVKILIDG